MDFMKLFDKDVELLFYLFFSVYFILLIIVIFRSWKESDLH